MTRFFQLLTLALALLPAGCDSGGGDDDGGGGGGGGGGACEQAECELRSDVQTLALRWEEVDGQALVDAHSAFALDLYDALRGDEGNLFYSPHSISVALTMAWGGARGETEAQMADVMRLGMDQEACHSASNALAGALSAAPDFLDPEAEGEPLTLEIVNTIFGRRDYTFEQGYLDLLARFYGAGLRVLDFVGDPEGARALINAWVAEATRDRIEELIPEGAITSDTVLVLVNAIFFKASWENPFEEGATAPADFTRLDGEAIQVPTMVGGGRMMAVATDDYDAVALPYVGDTAEMVVIAPTAGTFGDFEANLAERLPEVLDGLQGHEVTLRMPKFEHRGKVPLTEVLQRMGMSVAFSSDADFSGINGSGGLAITDVVHDAFVKVDEEGTEAAAATAVIIGETSAPVPIDVTIDRPFIFLVRHRVTAELLFLGRIVDPS